MGDHEDWGLVTPYLGRLCWKDLEEYWRGVWPGCAGELTLIVMCGLGEALCWLWSSVGRLRQAWICLQKVHHKSELLLLLMWNWGEAFITKNYAQRCMKKCTQWPPLSSVSLCALKWHQVRVHFILDGVNLLQWVGLPELLHSHRHKYHVLWEVTSLSSSLLQKVYLVQDSGK